MSTIYSYQTSLLPSRHFSIVGQLNFDWPSLLRIFSCPGISVSNDKSMFKEILSVRALVEHEQKWQSENVHWLSGNDASTSSDVTFPYLFSLSPWCHQMRTRNVIKLNRKMPIFLLTSNTVFTNIAKSYGVSLMCGGFITMFTILTNWYAHIFYFPW